MFHVEQNKIFWKNLGILVALILAMLNEPSFWKSMFFINAIFDFPLPKLVDCFRADPQQKPLPPNKGEYDYKDGKLIFKEA